MSPQALPDKFMITPSVQSWPDLDIVSPNPRMVDREVLSACQKKASAEK